MTAQPMKPDPPVTSMFMCATLASFAELRETVVR